MQAKEFFCPCLMCLGYLFSECACCCSSMACKCVGSACGTVGASVATRFGYGLLFLTNALLSWISLSDYWNKKLEDMAHGYLKISCPQGNCYGVLSVHRLQFALTLFHFGLSLLLLNVKSSQDPRSGIQKGFWGPKLLVYIGVVVGSFFIPNGFFIFYSKYLAIMGAFLFVLIQLVLLTDMAHTFTETMIEHWDLEQNNFYLGVLISTSLILMIGTIIATVLMFMWFGTENCGLNQFFITFNIILCIGITIASINPIIQENNPKSGLTQASIVSAYSTYLVFSSVVNEPTNSCNPFQSSGTKSTTVVLGAIFTFVAILYSTSSAATKSAALTGIEIESAEPLIGGNPPTSSNFNGNYPEDDEKDGCLYSYAFFHFVFGLACMYLSMLLTDWNNLETVESNQGQFVRVGSSWAAVWVKIVSSWVVILLYLWTLLAPIVLPDRDFF